MWRSLSNRPDAVEWLKNVRYIFLRKLSDIWDQQGDGSDK